MIDVYTLPSRGLPAVDPTARRRTSRAAPRYSTCAWPSACSVAPVVRLLPDAENVTHVANVRIGDSMTLAADERQLAHAIPRRRTSREPFSDEPVPDQIRNALSDAAHREGARLDFVPATRRDAVIAAMHDADVAQRLNPRVVDEVERWTRYREESTSGIPMSALGPSPVARRRNCPRLRLGAHSSKAQDRGVRAAGPARRAPDAGGRSHGMGSSGTCTSAGSPHRHGAGSVERPAHVTVGGAGSARPPRRCRRHPRSPTSADAFRLRTRTGPHPAQKCRRRLETVGLMVTGPNCVLRHLGSNKHVTSTTFGLSRSA